MAESSTITVGVIGGTGKTGRWAVKAALVRGFKLRLLARTPAKVEPLLQELFPGDPVLGSRAALEDSGRLAVVQGATPTWGPQGKAPEDSAATLRDSLDPLKEMMGGCDVVMCFLGMTVPKKGKPGWAVRPGIEAIITAAATSEPRPRLVLHQTSICLNDSYAQGKAAYGCCGCTAYLIKHKILKDCFADMEASETWVFENRAQLGVNATIIRPAVLDGGKFEKKSYVKDYSKKDGAAPNYTKLKSDDCSKKNGVTFYCGRQHVAEAFLDVAEEFCASGAHFNTEWSVFDKK